MIRKAIQSILEQAVQILQAQNQLPPNNLPKPEVDTPKNPAHGDLMTNFPLLATKPANANPRQIAELLAQTLPDIPEAKEAISQTEIAGPGFLNIRLNPKWAAQYIQTVLQKQESFANLQPTRPQKINVEFVSVNPNGPITIGSGRGAAYGSALCNLLETAGHQVHREYYINDGVNSEQMRLFAESVKAIVQGKPVPDNGYKGDYVHEVAAALQNIPDAQNQTTTYFQQASQDQMVNKQRQDLQTFRVHFDTWFSEQSLHDSGQVHQAIGHLKNLQVADTQPLRAKVDTAKGGAIKAVTLEPQTTTAEDEDLPPAENQPGGQTPQIQAETLWLRSTKFGDDQDRVLQRRDGRLTYIASDVAYHQDKFNRPPQADRLITILGPDHHGYIGRLTAVVAAMFQDHPEVQNLLTPDPTPLDPETNGKLYTSPQERDTCQAALHWAKNHLEVQIFQVVRFLKDGKPAPMRKRDGNIYALIDLVDEIGKTLLPEATPEEQQRAGADVARFFYLMRHHDTALDFDLELATRQSDENPVFYVQYAHARISSVVDKARESGVPTATTQDLDLLTHPKETALVLKIADLPEEIARTAEDYSVNRIATYASELARAYHAFYDNCRVVDPQNLPLSAARTALCQATAIAIRAALQILGVSTPDRM